MIELLNVMLNFGEKDIPVGRLLSMQRRIHFEFAASFLDTRYEISPFRLARKPGIQTFDPILFEGLPGVFNDSLPDGWGRLLLDRYMRAHGVNSIDLTPLDRLAHVGRFAIGALMYEPEIAQQQSSIPIDLDIIAKQTTHVFHENNTAVLDELVALNGSSAGARPKALIGLSKNKRNLVHGVRELPQDFDHWIVKFANSSEGNEVGAIEYVYSQMAKLAGIVMPETYLFPSNNCLGYFATKRFDRIGNNRLHMHTACGLLHIDFRIPSLDYSDLLLLTLELTKDMREVEAMYHQAVFNVCAHNRDDHAKNFTYLMDHVGGWRLSPAYDLTFSSGPNGEHSTTVVGEGRSPTLEHLYSLATKVNINKMQADKVMTQCLDALAKWPNLAKDVGISVATIKEISRKFIS